MVATLLEMATWVCRSGFACAGVSVGEGGADQAGGVDLGHTGCTGSGEGAVGFHEGQRICDCGFVALLDFAGHIQRGDRPQCGHGFHGAERHVVAGDRRGAGTGVAGDEARQFAVVGGLATVLVGESLPCQGGPDLCPDVVVDGGIPLLAEPGVVPAVGHCQCTLKLGLAGAHGESAAQVADSMATAGWAPRPRE